MKTKELALNVSFKESLIRGISAILLPMIGVTLHSALIFFIIPVTVYLYISALSHFCLLRYVWDHLPAHHHYTQLQWDADMPNEAATFFD